MLYIGNNKIIKGYIGNTPIAYAGFGKSELIKIEGGSGGEEYPENTVAVYTVSGTSAVAPFSVSGKASDWLETCRDNGDGTSTMIITASTPPTSISFQNVTTLLSVEFIDISRINNMLKMFSGCDNLTTLDLSSWDTSNVTDMRFMFQNCSSLTSLNISNWSFAKLNYTNNGYKNYNCYSMFDSCNALTELRLDNCDNDTIKKMANYSTGSSTSRSSWSPNVPTFIDGSVHNVYLKKSNWSSSTFRKGWTINYIEE